MLKTSTLAVILAAMIISVVLTGEADGAGLVKRAISTVGTWTEAEIPQLAATKIADGSVSSTEFQYINSLTSDVQTQLNTKESTTNKGAANGYAGLDSSSKITNNLSSAKQIPILSTSFAMTTNSSGYIDTSTVVSSTELDFLDGVTSAIQTQLNAKESTANKNQNNGYAGLGSTGQLQKAQQNGTTVYTNQANTYSGAGTQDFAGSILDNVASINDNSGTEATTGFIDMANAVLLCWEQSPAANDVCISVDTTEDLDFTDTDINFVDFGTNPLSLTETTDPPNPTTTQGQIFSRASPTGSSPSWKMDNRAEHPMIGVPMPPYKWGSFIPISATADGTGLLASATLDGTETYTYGIADPSSAIASYTGTTLNSNAGIMTIITQRDVYRGDNNAYTYVKWNATEITTNRLFIGFLANTTALPNTTDAIMAGVSGVGLCVRSTDTVYQFCSNDGSGLGAYASMTTTEDTNVHYVEIFTYDEGTTWCGVLDGGTPVCTSTAADIPIATTRMHFNAEAETTDTSGTYFYYYNVFTRTDK